MTEEIDQVVTEKVNAASRRGFYFWAVMVVLAVVGPALTIWISSTNLHRTERKLCAVVIVTDNQYHSTPPNTELGRRQAANFSQLRRELGCSPYEEK